MEDAKDIEIERLKKELDGMRAYHDSKDRLWRKAVVERTTYKEGLRKAIAWAEALVSKVPNREELNWTYLNDAREAFNLKTDASRDAEGK